MAKIGKYDNKNIIIAYIFLIWDYTLQNSYYFFVLIEQSHFGFQPIKKFKEFLCFFRLELNKAFKMCNL